MHIAKLLNYLLITCTSYIILDIVVDIGNIRSIQHSRVATGHRVQVSINNSGHSMFMMYEETVK